MLCKHQNCASSYHTTLHLSFGFNIVFVLFDKYVVNQGSHYCAYSIGSEGEKTGLILYCRLTSEPLRLVSSYTVLLV